MTITQKQENFCVEYVKCGNASEAYRNAYNASKMKEATINNNAYKLLQNNDIATRVQELRDKAVSVAIITIEQRKELLSRFAWEEESDKAMKAIDLLNKMDAVYTIKQSVEVSGALNVYIPPQDEDV